MFPISFLLKVTYLEEQSQMLISLSSRRFVMIIITIICRHRGEKDKISYTILAVVSSSGGLIGLLRGIE
jgi:hypothetical protein